MPDLFVDGNFRSAAGNILPWKIECDALSDSEINLFARLLARSAPAFGRLSWFRAEG